MIYLVRGNDIPLAVAIGYKQGEIIVPYNLTTATKLRLSLVGHGMHVFATDVEVSPTNTNKVTGTIPGRALLNGDYGLEVAFVLDGKNKRFYAEKDSQGNPKTYLYYISINLIEPESLVAFIQKSKHSKQIIRDWADP